LLQIIGVKSSSEKTINIFSQNLETSVPDSKLYLKIYKYFSKRKLFLI